MGSRAIIRFESCPGFFSLIGDIPPHPRVPVPLLSSDRYKKLSPVLDKASLSSHLSPTMPAGVMAGKPTDDGQTDTAAMSRRNCAMYKVVCSRPQGWTIIPYLAVFLADKSLGIR